MRTFFSDGIAEEHRCPMCKKIMTEAVLVDCCGTSFCQKCMTPEPPSEKILCPICNKLSKVAPNFSIRQAVEKYKNEKEEKK